VLYYQGPDIGIVKFAIRDISEPGRLHWDLSRCSGKSGSRNPVSTHGVTLDNKMMSKNRYFSEPIPASETISNNKGIYIPVPPDAIGMERLGNSLQPCQMCEIKAKNIRRTTYYFRSLPGLRSIWCSGIKLVYKVNSGSCPKLTSVSQRSILLELKYQALYLRPALRL
jgi:hypothetical protein